jgi:hypothetical protein
VPPLGLAVVLRHVNDLLLEFLQSPSCALSTQKKSTIFGLKRFNIACAGASHARPRAITI